MSQKGIELALNSICCVEGEGVNRGLVGQRDDGREISKS